jgi:hypothetical protein
MRSQSTKRRSIPLARSQKNRKLTRSSIPDRRAVQPLFLLELIDSPELNGEPKRLESRPNALHQPLLLPCPAHLPRLTKILDDPSAFPTSRAETEEVPLACARGCLLSSQTRSCIAGRGGRLSIGLGDGVDRSRIDERRVVRSGGRRGSGRKWDKAPVLSPSGGIVRRDGPERPLHRCARIAREQPSPSPSSTNRKTPPATSAIRRRPRRGQSTLPTERSQRRSAERRPRDPGRRGCRRELRRVRATATPAQVARLTSAAGP